MGATSLWSLMRYLFPHTIVENCSSVHSAAVRAASSSRTPYSDNVHALVDVNSLLHREADKIEDAASGPRMLAHAVRYRLDDAGTTGSASRFNSLNFTPGSTFMMTLDVVVAGHICKTVEQNSALRECIYSGSRVPGEGETKIVEHMLRQASRPWNVGDLFLILTGNSDAIIHLLSAPPDFRTGILDLDERVAFSPANMEQHLAPLFPNCGSDETSKDLHRVQQDLALLFILASGNDFLPALEKTSFNALWIAYQDVINSMTETDETSVVYLLDVAAARLNLETFARVLEKAEQLVSGAYLNTAEAEEHCSHLYVSVEAESLKFGGLEELDAVRKDQSTRSINDVPDVEEPRTKSNAFERSSTQIENASLYVDTLLWMLLRSTRGLTRDYRLMYDIHGPDLATLGKWIVAQLAEGKRAVYWDGPKAVSLDRIALVPALCAISVQFDEIRSFLCIVKTFFMRPIQMIPPEESQVVHPSFSKHISNFTKRMQTEVDHTVESIPIKKATFLSSIQSSETLFQTMDTRSVSELYQPALNFTTPCRARLVKSMMEVESVMKVFTENQAETDIDACMLPVVEPPSTTDSSEYGYAYVGLVGSKKKWVCFEEMDVKTGKWVWVRDLAKWISEAKKAYPDLWVDDARDTSKKKQAPSEAKDAKHTRATQMHEDQQEVKRRGEEWQGMHPNVLLANMIFDKDATN
ncbi:hypothetical protein HDU81_001697 [Chytriomyces hyalinus]|nr:hypothetical protein HDU81_001697 [Chytriomyces hyalinus]